MVHDPDPKPQKQYRYPPNTEEGLRETIASLEKQEILVETPSVCSSLIWLVLKADKKMWHLTIDYRELNKVTPRLTPAVAKFQEIMAAVTAGAKRFSALDLANAFFSIPLHKSVRYKFSFTFSNCQYTFSRVPQGLHNAPSICHKQVSQTWVGIPGRDGSYHILMIY